MAEPNFFRSRGPFALRDIAERLGLPPPTAHADRVIDGLAALEAAGEAELAFVESPRFHAKLAGTRAGAVIATAASAAHAPAHTAVLIAAEPARAFLAAATLFHAWVDRPGPVLEAMGVSPAAHVDPTARLEEGVTVEPGAVVGPRAEIGRGTVIAAGAIVGADARIGRECSIGPTAVVRHALIGDRVILHPGVKIGQDGFGYAMGPRGHAKLPQLGRVVIQSDVEIGAGTTIDRGAFRDTVIGEGTKIDNQVQIAHNCVIGRHCVIVAQVGIAGSCVLGDFVVLGGRAAVSDHVTIGPGARIAASSGVMNDVPAGATWAGTPARNARDAFREVVALRRLADKAKGGEGSG